MSNGYRPSINGHPWTTFVGGKGTIGDYRRQAEFIIAQMETATPDELPRLKATLRPIMEAIEFEESRIRNRRR